MVGIVVLGHGTVGKSLVDTAQLIVGPQDKVIAVPFDMGVELDKYRQSVYDAMVQVDSGEGVLFLTDLKGGTPCNVALLIAHERHCQVVTGVNIPMLVTVLLSREGMDVRSLAELAKAAGLEGVEVVQLEGTEEEV